MHEAKVQIKKLEKFQCCFCWEKHSYKIYKIYIHEFSIESPWNIYLYDFYYDFPTDEMFSNFPFFFVTICTFCTMQEKNYTFMMIIYCDFEES